MKFYLPEADVAVGVGVGGQVAAVRRERHGRYRTFVAVDVLQRKQETFQNKSLGKKTGHDFIKLNI